MALRAGPLGPRLAAPRGTCGAVARLWSPRDLGPRQVLPGSGLARQAEDALTDDVAVHLARTALDGVGATPEHPAELARQRLVVRGGTALPRRRVHAEQVGRQQLQPLVQLTAVHLADAALRPGRTAGG